MNARLLKLWQTVNASYWFYPALFAIAAVLLAQVTVWLDRNGWADFLNQMAIIQPARPDGASNMLTVISGSMIGVASTVFSITIAAVAYASGNYGPRLLTNFMEDKGNQLSLAVFIGTFVYAITVLRTVRVSGEGTLNPAPDATTLPGFVPQLSLLVAYILMALAVAVLVYFLNHIPASIRINTVLEGIGKRLIRDIEKNFPEEHTGVEHVESPPGRALLAEEVGYVQVIDYKGLGEIIEKTGGVLKLAVRTGDFVHPRRALAYWSEEPNDTNTDSDTTIRDCFALGGMRTPGQDLHFLIDELVEIGMRALSPGINDPFTAITAIHWLGAATAELGRRGLRRKFGDDDDTFDDRLILLNDDFGHYVRRGFGALRSAIATSEIASVVAFEAMLGVATTLNDESRVDEISDEGDALVRQAREHLTGPSMDAVEARYRTFVKRMSEGAEMAFGKTGRTAGRGPI